MTYYDTPHAFSADELRLAGTIAQHVAFGLSRIEAEAAMEQLLVDEQAARREAEVARAEADAANRSKDQFLAMLSHELRTPLNAILGWVRLLRGARLPAGEAARALEVIERNGQLQAQLVGDLLDVSRIAAGKLEIDRVAVDLALVARQAVEGVAADATAKRLDLACALDGATVLGDPYRLQQIVTNLLSNAIKFTRPGGRVEVRLARVDGRVSLSVADTGEGIEPGLLSRIFEPFEQGDRSITRRHGGLGLGLAIVRQLVLLHGGTIRADSAGPGRGASFTAEFPTA